MELIVSNISKHYHLQSVLDNVNMSIYGPQIIGLVGRNGVGKTTLLKIIAGLIMPDSGKTSIIGPDRRRKLSYMSERNPLYDDMYVAEYLFWMAQSYDLSNMTAEITIKLRQLGLQDVIDKKIGELSKGYRQRVGIAAALIGDPIVSLLDEPINGLDPAQILEIRNLLKAISKDRIIILSSHLMQEIEAVCDQVWLIKDKQLIEVSKNLRETPYRLVLNKSINAAVINAIAGVKVIDEHASYLELSLSDEFDRNEVIDQIFDTIVRQGAKIREFGPSHQKLDKLFN